MARPTFKSSLANFGNWLSERPQAIWTWMKENPKKTLFLGLIWAAGIAAVAALPPLVALLPAVPVVGPTLLAFLTSLGSAAAPFVFGAMAAVAMAMFSGLILGTIHLLQNARKPKGSGNSSTAAAAVSTPEPDALDGAPEEPGEDPLRQLAKSPEPASMAEVLAAAAEAAEAEAEAEAEAGRDAAPVPSVAANRHRFHAVPGAVPQTDEPVVADHADQSIATSV